MVPEIFAYPLPSSLDPISIAPLLCAGIIGFRAFQKARIPEKGKLGLVGFGSSAHIVLQLAKSRQIRTYVLSRGKNHQDFAKSEGADWVGQKAEELPVKLDSAIILAPAGYLIPPLLHALDKGGTLALAGVYMTAIPEMDYQSTLFEERHLCSVTANTRNDGHELLREAARIPIHPRTTVYPLEQANQALQDLKADKINGSGVLAIS